MSSQQYSGTTWRTVHTRIQFPEVIMGIYNSSWHVLAWYFYDFFVGNLRPFVTLSNISPLLFFENEYHEICCTSTCMYIIQSSFRVSLCYLVTLEACVDSVIDIQCHRHQIQNIVHDIFGNRNYFSGKLVNYGTFDEHMKTYE